MSAFPLRYAHGNILFGPGEERAALYRIEPVSYPFLARGEKEMWFRRLAQFAFACEADFSLWRVARSYSVERYLAEGAALAHTPHADARGWHAYLASQERALREARAHHPEVYLALSLAGANRRGPGTSIMLAADRARRRCERVLGVAAARPILTRELEALVAAEERAFARLTAILPARRATSLELQWLLRRPPGRGLAETRLEPSWEPNALVVESDGAAVRYEPLETDLVRLAGAAVAEEGRTLVVDAEEGRSYQALLCLGALPEEASFPGPRAELLSAPLEALDFPVDAVLHARWLGNRDALARARRRIPRRGVYVGATAAGARRPVLFDVAAPAREARPSSVLLAGTLGSGKTLAAELLAVQAALRGALVVDIDPKPDHALERVPALAGMVSVIELSGDERYRGMLDPLRVAPPSLREDLASSVFMELLPQAPPAWETQVRKAVREVVRLGASSSLAVVDRLAASVHPDAREAGEALAVWADAGLARLAFGAAGAAVIGLERPVTTIKASALALPAPGTPRADYSQAERLGVAVLKLVAAYALRLVSGDRSRAKVVLFDEAWFLLASSDGRRLVDRLNRLGRAENAALLLATQQLGDVGEIENLIGARFIFGQETPAEAERALALLGLDPSDRELVQRLRGYRRGRCLFRDLDDRIAELQIDLVDPALLEALDTTPGRAPAEAA